MELIYHNLHITPVIKKLFSPNEFNIFIICKKLILFKIMKPFLKHYCPQKINIW